MNIQTIEDIQSVFKAVLLLAVMASCSDRANAQEKLTNAAYEVFYITSSASKLEPKDALLKAAQGSQVYKCQSVELSLSKSQTSISLKNTKKPKK